jgi:RND family efflux transporter MFP subunit
MRFRLKRGSYAFIPAIALCAMPMLAQTYELVSIVSKPVARKVELPGEIQPFLNTTVTARVSGYVERVLVDRGSVVKQGDLLVELSAPELKAQISGAEAKVLAAEAERVQAEAKVRSLEATTVSAQAELASLQSTYDRLKAASQTPGAISGNELDTTLRSLEASRAGVEAQKANVDAQRSSLEALHGQKMAAEAAVTNLKEMEAYLRVTAPFDGLITERLIHPGAVAGPGSNAGLLVLQQVARLRVVVAVPEANVGGIAKGMSVEFKVPAYPERVYSGVVARTAQALDSRTRTMPVELDVNNKDGSLAPGMYATVQWQIRNPQPVLYVPRTSVVTTTERTFVIRDRNGQAEWVDVKKGPSDGDLVQVSGTLQAGDRILKRATDEIREGTALHPSGK